MPSNKLRLHVGLYARGNNDPSGEATYHWALLVTPKSENEKTDPAGTRHHVTNTIPVHGHSIPPWQYQVVPLRNVQTISLLVRITVAKVENLTKLERTLSQLPVDQYKGFTCRTWVADAVNALDKDGSLGTKRTGDWNAIQDLGTRYVKQKKDVGRWRTEGNWNKSLPATFSLIEDKETFP